ncbi:MAG TPA: hydroxylamine oxidation protein HaoB, partial [Nitrospiraceae bacterium]|nr:hydroxylamine oxidation protein HaoB [Nitrospiraceae bacterium]
MEQTQEEQAVTTGAAQTMEGALTRPSNRILPSLGIFLVAGGFLVLCWLAYLWLSPGAAPYHYKLVEEGGVDKFGKLGLEAWPDLGISKQEVLVEGVDQPVAVAYLARRGNAPPVMLSWENRSDEPVVFVDGKLSELTVLATAIAKHVPKDAAILAWWDTSRQIRLLTGYQTVFSSHLRQPLLMPSLWRPRSGAIEKYEREFWRAPASAEESQKFQRFADALAADPKEGVAMLRELTGGREAYVAVHLSDLYKLGLMRPDRLSVAYKDFPLQGGDVHGLSGMVKSWLVDNNYTGYTVYGLSENVVRAYFLTDAKSGNTLLAQMLPFTTSQ